MISTCECDVPVVGFCKACNWNHKRRSMYGHFPDRVEAAKYADLQGVCFICSQDLPVENTIENQRKYSCCSLECALFQQTKFVGTKDSFHLSQCRITEDKDLPYSAVFFLTKMFDECWASIGQIYFNGVIYPARKAAIIVRYGNNNTPIQLAEFECPIAPDCINPHHFKNNDANIESYYQYPGRV